MFTTNVYYRAFYIFIIALIPFTIARIALYQIYSDDFQNLSFLQTLTAFIHGFRFDAAIIITYIGLPLIFLLLPFQWAKSAIWQQAWAWFIFALLLLFSFTLAADIIYFGFVHRHSGPEIQLIFGDIPLMIDMAISSHLGLLVSFTICSLIAAKIWRLSFQFPLDQNTRAIKNSFIVLVIFIVLIIVGRGGLQHKPVRISDAFTSGDPSAAYLTINGTFAITQAMRSSKPTSVKFMPDEEAIRLTQKFVKAENEVFIDKNYPLMRKVTHSEASTSPNIVFLLVESFDAQHFDRLRELQGLKPFGSTPNLDEISKQGILFSHFYATGQRSMDGLAATLASVPTLPGFPYLGQGLEQNRLSFLGNIAKTQDYSTIFLQSSSRGSFHVDSIAAQAGFEQYFGAEDIPSAHKEPVLDSDWGAWDHDTLQFANEKFEQTKKPFVGYIFTSTTHMPWRIPADKWKKNQVTDDKTKYLNSLYYADWALGEFMEKAKQADYYKNTIFIITGDHISRFGIDTQKLTTRFQVPLIIFGPGIDTKVDPQVGNQMDILPTVIDLAKWEVTHSSLGVSLMQDNPGHFSFSVNGELINYMDKEVQLSINTQQKLSNLDPSSSDEELAKLRLTAIQQSIFNLLTNNKFYTPSESTNQ